MQNAIMASIYEQNEYLNSDNDTSPEPFEEDDLFLEEFSDSDI